MYSSIPGLFHVCPLWVGLGFSCRPYLQRNWDKRGCAHKIVQQCTHYGSVRMERVVMGWGGGPTPADRVKTFRLGTPQTKKHPNPTLLRSPCGAKVRRAFQTNAGPMAAHHWCIEAPLRRGSSPCSRPVGLGASRPGAPQVCKSSDADELLGCGLFAGKMGGFCLLQSDDSPSTVWSLGGP